MKTTVKGAYSFNKKRRKRANGLALLGFLLLPLSLVIGTRAARQKKDTSQVV